MTPATPETDVRLPPGRRGWLRRLLVRPRVFGPVLAFDLIRTARQGRSFLLRSAYVFALLVVLFLLYVRWVGGGRDIGRALTAVGRLDPVQEKLFATEFFEVFFAVQLAAVFLLTPAYAAASVADERERGTLDFLLVSDLEGSEIVFGKLAARILSLGLLLLAGLPVLGFLQLVGGVDPNLVLAGFGVTAATLVSLASLGVYNSVRSERPRGAVFATYAQALAFVALSLPFGAMRSVYNPFYWLGAGNVVGAFQRAVGGGATAPAIYSALHNYVVVHALFALLFAALAARRLRPAPTMALDADRQPRFGLDLLLRAEAARRPRPRVGDDPVYWREVYLERGVDLPTLAKSVLFLAGGVAFAIALVIFLCGLIVTVARGDVTQFANLWARAVGIPIAVGLLVAVAVRASTAFSGERDKRTLDCLLTTPLENREILTAKWLACLLSVREFCWPLVVVWGLALMAGGVHLLSLAMLAVAWASYAAFAVGVGLWCSLRCRTSLRATIWTLVALLAVGTGQPVLWLVVYPTAAVLQAAFAIDSRWAADLAHFGLTPPATLVHLTYSFGDWYSFDAQLRARAGEVGLAWAGVCVYAAAAALLWGWVRWRFGAWTGRMGKRQSVLSSLSGRPRGDVPPRRPEGDR